MNLDKIYLISLTCAVIVLLIVTKLVYKKSIVSHISYSIILFGFSTSIVTYIFAIYGWKHIFWIIPVAVGILMILLKSIDKNIKIPLVKLVEMNRKLSEGDLTQQNTLVNETLSVEIADLSMSFGRIVTSFQSIITGISSNANSLDYAASELLSTSTQIAVNSKEMTTQAATVTSSTEQARTSINSISADAEEMSSSANSVATSIEEMSASLNEVAKNCQNESMIVTDAANNSRTGTEIMDRLGFAAKAIGKVIGSH